MLSMGSNQVLMFLLCFLECDTRLFGAAKRMDMSGSPNKVLCLCGAAAASTPANSGAAGRPSAVLIISLRKLSKSLISPLYGCFFVECAREGDKKGNSIKPLLTSPSLPINKNF